MLIDFNYQVFVYVLILFKNLFESVLKNLTTKHRESSFEDDFRIQKQ